MMKKLFCVFFVLLQVSFVLADDFEDGVNAAKKEDYKKAASLLIQAGKQGNSMAQVFLGLMYKNGKGFKQNQKDSSLYLFILYYLFYFIQYFINFIK